MRFLRNGKNLTEVDYQCDFLCIFTAISASGGKSTLLPKGGQIRATEVSMSHSVLAGSGSRHSSGNQVLVLIQCACPQAIIFWEE